jgi:hypothetical protein
MKLGFWNGNPAWCNLGQGQPEVGDMAGDPGRITQLTIDPADQACGHINGTDALCTAVTDHHNRLYRQGKSSQYTTANVSIAAGDRLVRTRIFQTRRAGKLGHQVSDYTAHEDRMNSVNHRVKPVLVPTDIENGFAATPQQLREAIGRDGLTGCLVFNSCNPTGRMVRGDALRDHVAVARETALLVDGLTKKPATLAGASAGPWDPRPGSTHGVAQQAPSTVDRINPVNARPCRCSAPTMPTRPPTRCSRRSPPSAT